MFTHFFMGWTVQLLFCFNIVKRMENSAVFYLHTNVNVQTLLSSRKTNRKSKPARNSSKSVSHHDHAMLFPGTYGEKIGFFWWARLNKSGNRRTRVLAVDFGLDFSIAEVDFDGTSGHRPFSAPLTTVRLWYGTNHNFGCAISRPRGGTRRGKDRSTAAMLRTREHRDDGN